MALLRWYGSPGVFDSGLQLICIFYSLLFLIFLLTILHRFSTGFRSGEIAKSCWKMKSASLKIWSAEGSMKCSKISWLTGAVTLVFKKHNGPKPVDDNAHQIITDCGNLTLDFKQLGL